nr:helix-turn-helix domain-containing protein [Tahibacter harae]
MHARQGSQENAAVSKATEVPKLAFTVKEFRHASGICRTRIYELIAAGKLKTVKLGRSRLITAEAANEFIASLEKAA